MSFSRVGVIATTTSRSKVIPKRSFTSEQTRSGRQSSPLPGQTMTYHNRGKEPKRSRLLELSYKFNNFYFETLPSDRWKPFFCGDTHVGIVRQDVEWALREYPDIFDFSNDGLISLSSKLDTATARNTALDSILQKMRREKDFEALRGWRDETYNVGGPDFEESALFKMERSATC